MNPCIFDMNNFVFLLGGSEHPFICNHFDVGAIVLLRSLLTLTTDCMCIEDFKQICEKLVLIGYYMNTDVETSRYKYDVQKRCVVDWKNNRMSVGHPASEYQYEQYLSNISTLVDKILANNTQSVHNTNYTLFPDGKLGMPKCQKMDMKQPYVAKTLEKRLEEMMKERDSTGITGIESAQNTGYAKYPPSYNNNYFTHYAKYPFGEDAGMETLLPNDIELDPRYKSLLLNRNNPITNPGTSQWLSDKLPENINDINFSISDNQSNIDITIDHLLDDETKSVDQEKTSKPDTALNYSTYPGPDTFDYSKPLQTTSVKRDLPDKNPEELNKLVNETKERRMKLEDLFTTTEAVTSFLADTDPYTLPHSEYPSENKITTPIQEKRYMNGMKSLPVLDIRNGTLTKRESEVVQEDPTVQINRLTQINDTLVKQLNSQSAQSLKLDMLKQKIDQVNEYARLSHFDVEKRKEEYEQKKTELAKEYELLETKKRTLQAQKDKEEAKQRMFRENKNTYFKMKRDVIANQLEEKDISEQFSKQYAIFKQLDNAGLLNLSDEYTNYLQAEQEYKLGQYTNDKKRYQELVDNKTNVSEIDLEFRNLYDVFETMNEMKLLNTCDLKTEYQHFLNTYADFLECMQTTKYGLDNVHYLRDADTGPVIKVVSTSDELLTKPEVSV